MLVWISLIATLVLPGLGHLLVRRYLKGAVLAVLYAGSADLFLASAFLWPGGTASTLTWVSLGVAAVVWLYALGDIIGRLKVLRQKDFQKQKDDRLTAAQVAWLKDEHPEAERLLREILRMDDRDVEAWVLLGKVLTSVGRTAEAHECYRSALHLDGSGPWRWGLMVELGYADIKRTETDTS